MYENINCGHGAPAYLFRRGTQANGIEAELRPLARSAAPDSCRIVTWLALSAAEELMLGPGSRAGPPCRPIGAPVPGMYENIHCGHGLPAYLFRRGTQAKGIAAELRALARSAAPDSCRFLGWLTLKTVEEK